MSQSQSILSRRQCSHCGTPFAPRHEGEHFCCAGCEAVSKMIQAQGLGHFYDLRQGISTPINARQLAPDALDWLPSVIAQAEAKARLQTETIARAKTTPPTQTYTAAHEQAGRPRYATATLTLSVDGIHCVGCRWLIGELFAQQPCHETIEVDAQAHEIHLSWCLPKIAGEPRFNLHAFAITLAAFGYTLENPALPRKRQQAGSPRPEASASARKRLAPRLLLCGVFALNAVIFALPIRLGASSEAYPFLRLFGLLVILCATLSTGLAASYFLQKRPRATRGSTTLARGDTAPAQGTTIPVQGSTALAQDSPTVAQGGTRLRQLLGLLLVAACLVSLASPSLGLPALFAPDTVAAASFVTLLIAFAAKR